MYESFKVPPSPDPDPAPPPPTADKLQVFKISLRMVIRTSKPHPYTKPHSDPKFGLPPPSLEVLFFMELVNWNRLLCKSKNVSQAWTFSFIYQAALKKGAIRVHYMS